MVIEINQDMIVKLISTEKYEKELLGLSSKSFFVCGIIEFGKGYNVVLNF